MYRTYRRPRRGGRRVDGRHARRGRARRGGSRRPTLHAPPESGRRRRPSTIEADASSSALAGVWTGYIEAYAFRSGSGTVQIVLQTVFLAGSWRSWPMRLRAQLAFDGDSERVYCDGPRHRCDGVHALRGRRHVRWTAQRWAVLVHGGIVHRRPERARRAARRQHRRSGDVQRSQRAREPRRLSDHAAYHARDPPRVDALERKVSPRPVLTTAGSSGVAGRSRSDYVGSPSIAHSTASPSTRMVSPLWSSISMRWPARPRGVDLTSLTETLGPHGLS